MASRLVLKSGTSVSVPLGGSLTGLLANWLIPAYGWRSMFLAGAVMPLVLLALFWFLLPESPKYMALRPALQGCPLPEQEHFVPGTVRHMQ